MSVVHFSDVKMFQKDRNLYVILKLICKIFTEADMRIVYRLDKRNREVPCENFMYLPYTTKMIEYKNASSILFMIIII